VPVSGDHDVAAFEAILRKIIDPTGATTRGPQTPARAPRPARLRGIRIGFVDTAKQNADLLLTRLALELAEAYGVEVTSRQTKHGSGLPLDAPLLHDMAGECDVVVIGVGDCGSSCVSAIADGIAFERAGVPSAVICSDAFDVTARATAEVQGDPGYGYVTTPHPVASLTPDLISRRAAELLAPVVARISLETP
jgi:hypothetical protein